MDYHGNIKWLWEFSHKMYTFPENKRKGNSTQLILWKQYNHETEIWLRYYEKEKLKANITHDYRYQNPK